MSLNLLWRRIGIENLIVIGVNHKAASVAVRERVAFRANELPDTLAELSQELTEVVLLSTCNRTELYAVGDAPVAAARRYLSRKRAISEAELDEFFYVHHGEMAVRHLFTVTAGLDSMLLGEPQIQGQVKDALQAALKAKSARTILSRLFQNGLRVGKAVRSQTGICRQHTSIGQAAADLAHTFFNGSGIRPRDVLIMGAGEMASHVARGLAVNGMGPVIVANRTFARAQALAAELRGGAIRFDDVPDSLALSDVVICASSAPHLVLKRDDVAEALPGRNGRPLFLIDIAVPRDIDPAAGDLPGVQLYNIDDLQGVCDDALQYRQGQADIAMDIIVSETVEFMTWLGGRTAVPAVKAYRSQAETIRQAEVEKTLRQLGDISPQQRQAIETLSRSLVNKMLHQPTAQLKKPANQWPCGKYLQCMITTLGISDEK